MPIMAKETPVDSRGNIRQLEPNEEVPDGQVAITGAEAKYLKQYHPDQRAEALRHLRARISSLPLDTTVKRHEARLRTLGGGGVQPPPSLMKADGFRPSQSKQSRADRRREFRKNAAQHRRTSGSDGAASS